MVNLLNQVLFCMILNGHSVILSSKVFKCKYCKLFWEGGQVKDLKYQAIELLILNPFWFSNWIHSW